MKKPEIYGDCLVIGGGAAGLLAAKIVAEAGYKVIVAESLPMPGRKLLASGNGKCNFTNGSSVSEMIASFGDKARFVAPAIKGFPPDKVVEYFHCHNVPAKLVDGFYYFPDSEKSSDILRAVSSSKIQLEINSPIVNILSTNGVVDGAESEDKVFCAKCVLLAAGGRSYPALGGNSNSYRLIEKFGYQVNLPVPALTGIQCDEVWAGKLAGITLDMVKISLGAHSFAGTMLFTQNGISGYAALDISGQVNRLLAQVGMAAIHIDFAPEISPEKWRNIFAIWREKSGKKMISSLLTGYFPARLAQVLAGMDDAPSALLGKIAREAIIGRISQTIVHCSQPGHWNKAMATAGGVDTTQVNAKTLEGKLTSGLFFAGEFLDIDGRCGGYNLQWAFSSGYLAAQAIIKRNREDSSI